MRLTKLFTALILMLFLSGCSASGVKVEASVKLGINWTGGGVDVIEADYKMDLFNRHYIDKLLNDSLFDSEDAGSGGDNSGRSGGGETD